MLLSTYSPDAVDDGRFALRVVLVLEPRLLRDQSPKPVEVHRGAELLVLSLMVVPHTQLKIKEQILLYAIKK